LLYTWCSEDISSQTVNHVLKPYQISPRQLKLFLQQEDYTTDEDMVEGVEGKLGNGSGAGGILDLLKASRQVGGPDYAALT
jgi:hypothetical protein